MSKTIWVAMGGGVSLQPMVAATTQELARDEIRRLVDAKEWAYGMEPVELPLIANPAVSLLDVEEQK